MTQHDDRVYLLQMLDAAREARSYLIGVDSAEFSGDRMRQRAVIYVVQIIGEASKRVSGEVRRQLVEVPWVDIVGMRNRLVHDYMGVDIEEVWRTVNRDLPVLIQILERALSQIDLASESP